MSPLKVTVQGLPEGVNVDLHLAGYPKTTEEFELIVEAMGGPSAWRTGYGDAPTYIIHDAETGQRLFLYPPKDCEAPKPKGHPFICEFAERIEAANGGGES